MDRHTKPMIHKGAKSWYFCPDKTKLSLNQRKRENSSFLEEKNNNEIIINHQGTGMVGDGEY